MTDELIALLERRVAEAAALRWTDLPDDLREHAAMVLADTVGVMAAGAGTAEIGALVGDPLLGLGPAGPARTLGPGRPRGDPATVAWVNGTAGTFLELDEGYRPTGHPAIHVLPAALATAETVHADGARLGAALVAGYEVAARLFESFRLPQPMHPHGHFGALGAATAVAMLRGDDPVALVRVAATQPLLTGWSACYEGATARNSWTGHANRAGVQASMLHRAGFTGSLSSHLSVVAPYALDPGGLRDPVQPSTLRIRRNYVKLHSACALTHSALDATVRAWSRLSGDPDEVAEVVVDTVSANLRVDRQAAPNALSTRFSLPYAVAAAIRTGATGVAAFDWRPDVAALAARVRVRADPELDARWPDAAPARVRISLASGAVAEVRVDNPHGHHSDPATRDELRAKFVRLGGAAGAFDALTGFADADDCAALPL
ncbi:MmgE/PrpD family protein [Jiangella muralis]|uniref:MmgE/PrpD family protein n=1 Tax=Jiangella muralis TaxID=702383 RepID=UPI00069E25ED|nr:MmgE/PrpD family protein [Jiangella muralis]